MDEVEALCDEICILRRGTAVFYDGDGTQRADGLLQEGVGGTLRGRFRPIDEPAFLGSWLLTMVSTLSIGLMVGGIARNAKSASVIACLLYFPMLIGIRSRERHSSQ